MKACSTLAAILALVSALITAGCGTSMSFKTEPAAVTPPKAETPPPAAELKPKSLEIARQLVAKGFFDVALVQLRAAEADAQPGAEIEYLKGVCFRETERHEQAGKAFGRALAVDPDYAPAHNGLGLLHDLCGRRDKAADCYQRAIALDPARAEYFNNLGYSALLARRLSEAETHLRRSLALRPDYPRARNNLAICYGLMGQTGESWRLLQRTGKTGQAYNNMGVIWQLRGDNGRARKMYTKALESNPALSVARGNREGLEKAGRVP